MARIYKLDIKNFRGIKEFSHIFDKTNLICLVGRGDSGKTTILSAIYYVLYPNWNLTFSDTDFYNCDVNNSIEIEATLIDVPEELLKEDKYGLYIRGIDNITKEIKDEFELEEEYKKALTIRLEVKKDLEPKWYVVNERQDSPVQISYYDRAKLNTFMISDSLDTHFYWRKGSPLYALLKQEGKQKGNKDNILTEVIRDVKNKIDTNPLEQFQKVIDTLKPKVEELGIKIPELSTSLDFKDIFIKEGKLSLHDDKIPLRLKGKGTKRLVSIALQMLLIVSGSITLIDEIEQGLEPDRVKHLVRTLYKNKKGQIFITTHSQNIIEELEAENILKIDNNKGSVTCKQGDERFQDVMRACPEAAYAKKVIVCEGKTEIGICRALDEFRIKNGKTNLSALDVVYTNGNGKNLSKRALKLNELGLNVCVLCDSDDENINKEKEEMKNVGIEIFHWDDKNSIEQQVFNDLPWKAVKELIEYRESQTSEDSVKDSVNSKYEKIYKEKIPDGWKENDSPEIRKAIGEAAKEDKEKKKKKGWFKRIDHGEFLGSVIFKYFDQIKDKKLGETLQKLSDWIDK